jgi:2-keto-4-pentenoate hydratase
LSARHIVAAATIVACRQRRLKILALPQEQRPVDLVEAYLVQRLASQRFGTQRIGWKVACTSAAAQASYPVTHPVAGPIHQEADLSLQRGGTRRFVSPAIEAEIVFGLRCGLGGSDAVSRQVLQRAVGWIAGGIEVVDTLFPDKGQAGVPTVVAGGHAAGVVIGARKFSPASIDLAAESVEVSFDGELVAAGSGSAVLGDPWNALQWLAQHLMEQGTPLRAGDIVFTGSCTRLAPVAAPARVVAKFANLGSIDLVVSSRSDGLSIDISS